MKKRFFGLLMFLFCASVASWGQIDVNVREYKGYGAYNPQFSSISLETFMAPVNAIHSAYEREYGEFYNSLEKAYYAMANGQYEMGEYYFGRCITLNNQCRWSPGYFYANRQELQDNYDYCRKIAEQRRQERERQMQNMGR